MKSIWKFAIFYVVTYAVLCSADGNHLREGEACLVQYLKGKGKLSANFQSTLQATSQCRIITPLTLHILKSNFNDLITNECPKSDSECLKEEFDNRGTVDYIIKTSAIENSKSLTASEKQSQLDESRNQLRHDLENIAIQCNTDNKHFINIFNEYLGIKNESLEVLQRDYCISKFAVDNKLLEADNIEINNNHIDSDSVNCDYIIDIMRSKNEKDLSDKMNKTPQGQRSLECIMDGYRDSKVFDYTIALEAVKKMELSSETKETETNRISQKIAEFILVTVSCMLFNV